MRRRIAGSALAALVAAAVATGCGGESGGGESGGVDAAAGGPGASEAGGPSERTTVPSDPPGDPPPPDAASEPLAPDFYLPVLDAGGAPPDDPAARKDAVKLSDYRGKTVVLNFWATWCRPCVEEMPMLDSVATAYRDRGVVVLGVLENDMASKGRAFLDEMGGVSYPVVRSVDLSLKRGFGIRGLPYTFLIRPDGRIAHTHPGGPTEREVLEGWLEPMLDAGG